MEERCKRCIILGLAKLMNKVLVCAFSMLIFIFYSTPYSS